jgi:ABC-type uncharacterized transport system involved in gliding motility auxiliary subunit
MKEQLNKLAPSFPYLGLVLIVAGLITWMITRTFDLVPNVLVIAGIILLSLFAFLRPHDVRTLFGTRSARYGTSALLSTLFLLAIGVILYWLAFQNDDWRIDVTEGDEFTPLAETVELLENLDEPVKVIGFYTAQSAFQQSQAESVLENLEAVSSNFSYEFRDPELFPLEAERYELNFDGTLVFTKGEGDNFAFSKAGSSSDRDIHTALVKVVNPVSKKLYLITGHGEFDKDSFEEFGLATAIAFVQDLGFTVENLNLFTAGAVPDDATAIAIINQEAPLTAEEVTAIQTYLAGGGSAFIARDAIVSEGNARAEADGLNAMLLADWGVTVRNDIIIDPAMAQAGLPLGFTFIGTDYGNSPIINDDLANLGVLFDLSRSINIEPNGSIAAVELVLTSPEAWGESNIELLATQNAVNPDPEDAQGNLAVGVSLEHFETGGRLVVFGDAGFVTNGGIAFGGNGNLFANALNWLADDEIAIDLVAREQIQRQVIVPETQLRLLRLLSVWLGPGLMIAVGMLVWRSRRNRR